MTKNTKEIIDYSTLSNEELIQLLNAKNETIKVLQNDREYLSKSNNKLSSEVSELSKNNNVLTKKLIN